MSTNQYSSANCTTVRVGRFEVPTIFLGDNGFLRKFGSMVPDDLVMERMADVIRRTNFGIAAGDERLLALARRAEHVAGRRVSLMHHCDLPLELGGEEIRYRRCGATLMSSLRRRGVTLLDDPVLGYLEQFDLAETLTPVELEMVALSSSGLQRFGETVEKFRPELITVGGDWLDMLLVSGGECLAADGLERVTEIGRANGAAVVITLYVGALVNHAVSDNLDGLMASVNQDGVAMLPTRDATVEWVSRQRKALVAMHVLGARHRTVQQSLQYVNDVLPASVSVVGASRPETINALIDAVSRMNVQQG